MSRMTSVGKSWKSDGVSALRAAWRADAAQAELFEELRAATAEAVSTDGARADVYACATPEAFCAALREVLGEPLCRGTSGRGVEHRGTDICVG